MQPDVIPNLPNLDPSKYDYEDEDYAISDFIKADRKIMMYENKEGRLCILFNKIDEIFYADFVVSLSRPDKRVKELFEFLKLCIEGVRCVIQCNKKGHHTAIRIENYIKKMK